LSFLASVVCTLSTVLSICFQRFYCFVWTWDVLLLLASVSWYTDTLFCIGAWWTSYISNTVLCSILLSCTDILWIRWSLLRYWSSSCVCQRFWLLEFGFSDYTVIHGLSLHQIHKGSITVTNSWVTTHNIIMLDHKLRWDLLCWTYLMIRWDHDIVLGSCNWSVLLHYVSKLDPVISSLILILCSVWSSPCSLVYRVTR